MFHLKLALKYLKGRGRFLFKSSNLLSLLGIIIGVFSLLVVSSVMNGFESDMRRRVIGFKSEIKVHNLDYSPLANYDQLLNEIIKAPGIVAVAPVCENELMLQNKKNIVSSVCYGIDYDSHNKIIDLQSKIRVGVPTKELFEDDGIILGLDMSLNLNVTVGEYVQLFSPIGTEPTPFGLLPKSKKFKVNGLFISGMPEYDKVFSFISLKNSQYFLGLKDEISYIEIKTDNSSRSYVTAKKLQSFLGNKVIVEDWSEFEANLFNAIKMEKVVMFLVLALMIILASFNMIGNFVKLVIEKKTEIGILKALGASERDIKKIFIYIGLIVGFVGTFIGLFLAVILLNAQRLWHFIKIPVPGFPLHYLPVEIRFWDFIIVPIVSILISYLTTLHPAKKTLKIEPIKIIRS